MVSRILCVLSLVGLLLPVQYAEAYEVLTAQELASNCKAVPEASDSTDGQYCIRYIQGFIDGAIATDARVMINIESELPCESGGHTLQLACTSQSCRNSQGLYSRSSRGSTYRSCL